jgi:PTS system glucitol/sorbitol-specific IIA component
MYHTTITEIGILASEALADGMLIIFDNNAPSDVGEYCFLHPHSELKGEIKPGMTCRLNGIEYPITAVGEVVNTNLSQLGHITIQFNGAELAELPGTVHARGVMPAEIAVGSELSFI